MQGVAKLKTRASNAKRHYVMESPPEAAEVVLSCWIDTDSDAERLNVRLGKPL